MTQVPALRAALQEAAERRYGRRRRVLRGVRCAVVMAATDGKRRTLKVAEGGLVAIANAPAGSAVVLHKQGGGRRTDAFRPDPRFGPGRVEIQCSDGTRFTAPTEGGPPGDPCAALPPRQVGPTRG